MNEDLEIKIGKAIHRALTKNLGSRDVIAISEAIKHDVILVFDMFTEDSGMGTASEGTLRDIAWNIRDMQQEPAARQATIQGAIPPAPTSSVQSANPKAKSLLVVPGEKEFLEAAKSLGLDGGKISAIEVRKRAGSKKKSKDVLYWDPVDLIEQINANTPERVFWEVQTADGPRKLMADRNTINQVVEHNVVLTYKHPGASNTSSGYGGADAPVNISDLTARVLFSCYEENIDIEQAMNGTMAEDGKSGIMEQLRGIYRDRSGGSFEPNSGPEPPPLMGAGGSIAMRGSSMTDSYNTPMDPNFRATSPTHVGKEQDTLLRDFKQQMAQSNKMLTPSGRR